MEVRFITPALVFMMKYFFDIEKELTQQLLLTAQMRLLDCRDFLGQLYQMISAHR